MPFNLILKQNNKSVWGQQLKELRKNLKKANFVTSAIKVLKKDGLKNFSARKVADETGYNVALIYNYFKNLDHLKTLASIHFTSDYVNELTETSKKLTDPLMIYLNMWILFSKHALFFPCYYYNVFFEVVSQTGELNLFEEYYNLFKEEKPGGSEIDRMIEIAKTVDREAYVMNMCVEKKIISEKSSIYIQDIHIGYFKTILNDIANNGLYKASVEIFQKHMLYFIYVMYHYVDKKYTGLLDAMIKFYSEERTGYENFFEKEIFSKISDESFV